MPSHARPASSKPLKAEDDWTRVKDPREKKRIQNRVAQRTYRHRMKARLGELQARLEQHEGPQPRHETPASMQGMAPQTFPSPSPSEQQQQKALPRLDTSNGYQYAVEEYLQKLPNNNGSTGQQTYSHARSHSLPPNYGLLSPPTHSEASSAITPDAGACPSLNAHYTDLSALPLLDDMSNMPSVSGPQSIAAGSTGTTPQVNEASTVIVDHNGQSTMSFFNSNPIAQIPAPFLVDPTNQVFGTSPPSLTTDNASQAGSDWAASEGAGFQEEVLSMMESVIRVENSSARHDLIAKMAPLIESCDENGIYNSEILAQMKQSMQDDLPNSWAFAKAMSTDSGAAWQADRSNISLASMILVSFAGRISNEKLLCLIGGCL